MLRASIEYHGSEGELRGVTEGAAAGDGGILHGARLARFAEAAVRDEPHELQAARDALRAAAGSAALVDAAAVVGNFQRMVRIADGTGIPLDALVVAASQDFREELGIDALGERRAEELGTFGRLGAPLLRRVAKAGLRLGGWRARSRSRSSGESTSAR